MTIFGPPWHELKLEDVAAFLAEAEPEPLLWEGKGVEAKPHEVRRQVCGFANSHDGGYLIIGASQSSDGAWTLDGVEFPNEPPTWVTDIVGDGGVSPYPEGLDVRAWPTENGRHVGVVKVPPIATPPCNTRGTVYERVSGKTIHVRDPVRLAELFARGDNAGRTAEAKAGRAALVALELGRSHPAHAGRNVQFGLGLAAAGYLPDIGSRLFTDHSGECVMSSIQTVLSHDPLRPQGPPVIGQRMTQESRIFTTQAADPLLGHSWILQATRDGAIGVYWVQGVQHSEVESIVDGPLRRAWKSAEEILTMLGPQGPRYLQVIVAGGAFPSNSSTRDDPTRTSVSRGPIDPGVDGAILASIERELRRALGQLVYEG